MKFTLKSCYAKQFCSKTHETILAFIRNIFEAILILTLFSHFLAYKDYKEKLKLRKKKVIFDDENEIRF